MIIQSIEEALTLPSGRFYLQTAFCDLEGIVNEKNLTVALAILGEFPVEATCQAEIIVLGYLIENPEASCRWEPPEEKTP
jgi:hypothetical protein